MKPRIKAYLIGGGKCSFWVMRKGNSFAYLEDVYRLKSFDKAFWYRINKPL